MKTFSANIYTIHCTHLSGSVKRQWRVQRSLKEFTILNQLKLRVFLSV